MKNVLVLMGVLFSALCISCGSDDEVTKKEDSKEEKILVITPNKSNIYVGQETSFEVKNSIGKTIKVFEVVDEDNKNLPKNLFKATKAGTYKFYASSRGYEKSKPTEVHVSSQKPLELSDIPDVVIIGDYIPIKVISDKKEINRDSYEIYDTNKPDIALELENSAIKFEELGEYEIYAKSKNNAHSDSNPVKIKVKGRVWPQTGVYKGTNYSPFKVIDNSTINLVYFYKSYTLSILQRDPENKKYLFKGILDVGSYDAPIYFIIRFVDLSDNQIKVNISSIFGNEPSRERFLSDTSIDNVIGYILDKE